LFMAPSWAVSLMTISGSFLLAAAWASLVSKSSKNAVTLLLMPVLSVNLAARDFAVASAGPAGGLRIQISMVALGSCPGSFALGVLLEQPVSARATTATSAIAARRLMTSSPVYICGHHLVIWRACSREASVL